MFSYRGLFLVVIISLASIVLADVLVQPGYEHQNGNNPQYQSVPQYRIQPPTEYHAQQLPNQESMRNLPVALTSYYDQDRARSHGIRYTHRSPYYHHHYHYSRPHHLHYAKIGAHGYTRPSMFVGYPQPVVVHNWGRSRRSVPTSIDSRKSPIVAHDNDVAAKSPLTDVKHPIDSLLSEHEPTNTNVTDKRVEKRQNKNDHVTRPFLLGLFPEKMYPRRPQGFQHTNTMQYHKALLTEPSIPMYSDEQSSTTVQLTDPSQSSMICQENSEIGETRVNENYENSRVITNRPSIRWQPSWNPSSSDEKEDETPSRIIYDKYYGRSKYRDASYKPFLETLFGIMQNNMIYYWPGYYGMYGTYANKDLRPQVVDDTNADKEHFYYEPVYQVHQIRAAHQELGNKPLQEITNMDMADTAKSRQDKIKLNIPYSNYLEKSPTTTNALITTTSVQPQSQQPFVTYIPRYKNNKEGTLSGTGEMIGAPYFNRIMSNPGYDSYYTGNYQNYNSDENSNEREYPDYENFYIDLNKENSNSAHHIKPSSSQVPDYDTNISARNNLGPTIPEMQTKLLEMYNYLLEHNLEDISPDYKYPYSSNPSDTPLYDTFSSPVYY